MVVLTAVISTNIFELALQGSNVITSNGIFIQDFELNIIIVNVFDVQLETMIPNRFLSCPVLDARLNLLSLVNAYDIWVHLSY